MPEVIQSQAAPSAAPQPTGKKRRGKRVRTAVTAAVVVAVLAVGGVLLFRFLTAQSAVDSTIQFQEVSVGTIQSTVTGSGNARAKEAAAITLSADGTVREVFVSVGDVVYEGQPLYTVFSQAAYDNVTAAEKGVTAAEADVVSAEKNVTTAQRSVTAAEKNVTTAENGVVAAQAQVTEAQAVLTALRAERTQLEQTGRAALTVSAPFAGKLTQVSSFSAGQQVSQGDVVAQLVNDKQLRLSQYFSYAYAGQILAGQSATVTIPAVLGSFSGQVERVNMVNYISPEGGTFFEVVVLFNNPGTLTADMAASATVTTASGVAYPYEDGKTAYAEVRTITAQADGPVLSVGPLMNYADVTAGQTLLTLGTTDLDSALRAKDKEIAQAEKDLESAQEGVTSAREAVEDAKTAVQDALDGVEAAQTAVTDAQNRVEEAKNKVVEAQEALDNFNAVAPISGTVTSSILNVGDEVKGGTTVLTISNTVSMAVEITVDDRNISFIKPGMTVELSDYYGNVYLGTVSTINIEGANSGNGVTNYPVTLTVENDSGTLTSGMYLNYSFVASQSDDCLMVPTQSVKYVSDSEGSTYSVVFIQADQRPENAVDLDLPDTEAGQTPKYPSPADGYYAVPVVTGLSDTYNVEIKSGLTGDELVFVSYYVDSAYGW